MSRRCYRRHLLNARNRCRAELTSQHQSCRTAPTALIYFQKYYLRITYGIRSRLYGFMEIRRHVWVRCWLTSKGRLNCYNNYTNWYEYMGDVCIYKHWAMEYIVSNSYVYIMMISCSSSQHFAKLNWRISSSLVKPKKKPKKKNCLPIQ